MRCSRIKQNCCRVRVCKEHTQYHILGLLGFLDNRMVDLVVGEILLPLRTLLLIGSLVRLPGGTILIHVAWKSTLETRAKSLTSRMGGILLVRSCRTRNLLYVLPRLLHNWTCYLLLGMEHWISRMLCLKVGMLHQELGMLVLKLRTRDLYRCKTWEWGSDKLIGM
jgi:hypothetical protein